MGKSLRSKWRRKCLAVKRIRYAVKELDILKKTVANKAHDIQNTSTPVSDDLVIEVDAGSLKKPKKVEEAKAPAAVDDAHVSPDVKQVKRRSTGIKSSLSLKNLCNKDGNYPIWVHNRKIKNMKKKAKNIVGKRKNTKSKAKGRSKM